VKAEATYLFDFAQRSPRIQRASFRMRYPNGALPERSRG